MKTDPAAASAFLRAHLEKVIRLAESGNTDAAQRLLHVAAGLLRGISPEVKHYEPLVSWLAERLESAAAQPKKAGQELRIVAGKGRPPRFANDFRAAKAVEEMRMDAARAVSKAIRQGARTKENRRGDPTAFEVAQAEIADKYKKVVPEATIRRWYEERRKLLPR